MSVLPPFGFEPEKLPRESRTHYIGLSDSEIHSMLNELGLNQLEDLYSHIPQNTRFSSFQGVGKHKNHQEIAKDVYELACKNQPLLSFAGDGIQAYKVPSVIGPICGIRELTTAYTPYQPERSQGTLMTLWIYQSLISMLTGFEAVNASMWDRSTCAYEAIQTALRLKKGSTQAIVFESIYPGDLEVLKTLSEETRTEIVIVPVDKHTGQTCLTTLKQVVSENASLASCILFPQTNHFGVLEQVDLITDLAHEHSLQAIAIIDPMLLGTGGLKAPAQFGKCGADMIVGEGQHLAIGPNFGGPGLGIFGIRFHENNKNAIRSTAGRYVGHAKDLNGVDCKVMVLSTREQHIRKEKATSNICSNQSFVASIAGAGILGRGENGLFEILTRASTKARFLASKLASIPQVKLAFPDSPFFHEFCLSLPQPVEILIKKGLSEGILPGVDISSRGHYGQNLLLVSVTDIQNDADLEKLIHLFTSVYGETQDSIVHLPPTPNEFLRQNPVGLPNLSESEIIEYYQHLGTLNVSPDKGLYPLGSCTMKYNPYINDWAASLSGFTDTHPQAPESSVQGNLELLYRIQNLFSKITGLPAVTTQPVAGAQGELVGIKMFQAYHRDHSKTVRDIILLPRSAHGTNFATATVAGYEAGVKTDKFSGIQLIEADSSGQMDIDHLKSLLTQFCGRIAGIMVTNPNTCGISETRFKEVADLIHAEGGLVYMDGANMNAIAGWLNLGAMGVDAVHQNLHKTWSIPHGGGGPGDCVVAVSEKLIDYLPGIQVIHSEGGFKTVRAPKSIGSFHRHFGNFAHKIRCYTYLLALGEEGIRKMSATAVLSSRYLLNKLKDAYPSLPEGSNEPRMHEFILTLPESAFLALEKAGVSHAQAIGRVGKLFLDFGLHAPTVAWPETYGLMIEPTESFTQSELDKFSEVVLAIRNLLHEHPEVLLTVPHFTPIRRVDDVTANKNLVLSEHLRALPYRMQNLIDPSELIQMPVREICSKILEAHKQAVATVRSH
ncbi:MAG: aminomethyl-transferring glycine dehydrogenase subunit GcvPB [Candidatus Cloacimonetes bacterium]|nr:aminomethyl-transferring glycine dehydrogenase subunit GcvPB [Candidatus Cloacimonadota bacterium]